MPLAEIHVTLKPALFDAQGETIKKALHQLGHTGVQNARIGKYITLEIEGTNPATLQGDLDLMCQQLLANPVIEDFEITFSGLPTAAFDPLVEAENGAGAEAVITSRESGGTGLAASTSGGGEALTTSGVMVSDPFTVDFRSYQGMPTEAKLALRTLSLRKHGAWIESQLSQNRASWILCVGQNVLESGLSLDSYPTDQHLLKLGVQYDLVPWVFTRPNH